MKTLLGAALSLALVCGTMAPVQAELLKNLKMGGEIEVHSVGDNNLTDFNKNAADKDGQAQTRVLINANFDLNEDVAAEVSAGKFDRTYGSGAQTATGVEGVVTFTQANMTMKNVEGLDIKLGRQYYGKNGDLLVYYGPSRGPAVRTLPVTAVDAFNAWRMYGDHMHASVIIGKTAETGARPTTDTDLRGIELACTKNEKAKLELRLYNVVAKNAAVADDSLWLISPRVSGNIEGIGYSAQAVLANGQSAGTGGGNCATTDCKAKGTAFLVGVEKGGIDFAGKLKVMAEFGMGSGDKSGTDGDDEDAQFVASDYRPGSIWGSHGALLASGTPTGAIGGAGLTNLTTFNIGVWHDTSFNEKLGWGLRYYSFAQTEKAAGSKAAIGSEIDLDAMYKVNKSVNVSAGLGQFMPNKDNFGGADDATLLYYANFHVMF